MTMKTSLRIGWIGTGIMGNSMCNHLLKAGYSVTVYNRTIEKCESLEKNGAKVVASPAQVALDSDVVFVIVGYPTDVKNVILNEKNGVLTTLKKGGIIIDMTTSEPSLAIEIHEKAKIQQIQTIDAPVSGGDTGAQNGTLSIMLGGEESTVLKITPILQHFASNIQYMGKAGSGQHTKMINQILIATNMIGVVEGLLYASKAGLNMKKVIQAIGSGAAGSWSINNLGPRIADRNFEPGFMVEHFIKDMGIALKEAQKMHLALPGLALANQFYLAVKAQGHERLGTQALILVLEQMNGIVQSTEEEKIEKWTEKSGLNKFGDEQGTMYMGCTPLFDESTGEEKEYLEFMLERYPDRPWL